MGEVRIPNPTSTPCVYCAKRVGRKAGFSMPGKDASWHDECFGSGLKLGRDRYYDHVGMFTEVGAERFERNYPASYKNHFLFHRNAQEDIMSENTNPNAPLHETGKLKCWTIWNPESARSSAQTYDTPEAAWLVAEELAQKYDTAKFLVMESIGCAAVEKPVVRRDFAK